MIEFHGTGKSGSWGDRAKVISLTRFVVQVSGYYKFGEVVMGILSFPLIKYS